MKKILITIITVTLFAVNAFAQTDMTEGHITYTITALGNDPMTQAVNGSTNSITLKDSMVRVDINSSMIQSKIIMNNSTSKGTMLLDFMGNKYAVIFSPDDNKKEQEQMEKSYDVKYIDSTKIIGSHVCKKAIITLKEIKKELTVWYDPTINLSIPIKNMFSKIKYLQVQYGFEQRGMDVLNTLTSFDTKPVDSSVFTVSTDGYTVMSYDDFKSAMQGMVGH